MLGARRIRSEKLREHQYIEGYVKSFEGKGVEWDGYNNVELMWEQVKGQLLKVQEVRSSLIVGGGNPKTVW